jgi:hypothetical protein
VEFGEVLNIRRGLGRAVATLSDEQNAGVKLHSKLRGAPFSSLFDDRKALGASLRGIIKAAIDLKGEMTRELAIYRCGFPSYSDQVKLDGAIYEVDEDFHSGSGFRLCVFPCFVRKIRNAEGEIQSIPVTRAKVVIF